MTRHKYNAQRTEIHGITFASKKEARYYADLKILERTGHVRDLELQPHFPIEVCGQSICSYYADFRYYDVNKDCYRVIDVKGMDTPASRLKRKLVEAIYSITVEVV